MNDIDDYISRHISPEPPLQQQVCRDTYLHRLYPQMCSGHIQGRLLKMLTQMIAPQRILELGTFTGYATLCLAEGMPEGAEIHTVEIDDEHVDELLDTFSRAPRSADIHLHIGDALEVVPGLHSGWDLVFIDANKRNYCDYYRMLLPLMRRGGYMIVDNTLWYDKIDNPDVHDPQTMALREFNDMVAGDPRVEKAIIPVRDGMTIIRVL